MLILWILLGDYCTVLPKYLSVVIWTSHSWMSNKGMTANTTPGNCRLWLNPSSKAELSPMVGMGVHVFVSYPNQLHPILHSKGIGIGDEPTNLRNMLLLVCNLNCGHYSMLHVFCHNWTIDSLFSRKSRLGQPHKDSEQLNVMFVCFSFFGMALCTGYPRAGLQRTSRFLFPQVEKASALGHQKWR